MSLTGVSSQDEDDVDLLDLWWWQTDQSSRKDASSRKLTTYVTSRKDASSRKLTKRCQFTKRCQLTKSSRKDDHQLTKDASSRKIDEKMPAHEKMPADERCQLTEVDEIDAAPNIMETIGKWAEICQKKEEKRKRKDVRRRKGFDPTDYAGGGKGSCSESFSSQASSD